MQFCLVGTPGSGKSYDAVRMLCKILLEKKRNIYTNIDGLGDPQKRHAISLITGLSKQKIDSLLHYMTKEEMLQVGSLDGLPLESVVIIDEVHKLISNRDYKDPFNIYFSQWASTHRHDGHDVILITQSIEKVDKHVRSLTEWCYLYRKINFVGSLIQNRYIRYTYDGEDHSGVPFTKSTFPYDRRYFSCYKSYSAKGIQENNVNPTTNILRHPIFYSIPVLLIIMLYFGSKSSLASGDLFGSKKMMNRVVTSKAQTAANPGKKSNQPVSPVDTPGNLLASNNTTIDGVKKRPGEVYDKNGNLCGAILFTYAGVQGIGNLLPDGAHLIKCFHTRRHSEDVRSLDLPPQSPTVLASAGGSVEPPSSKGKSANHVKLGAMGNIFKP